MTSAAVSQYWHKPATGIGSQFTYYKCRAYAYGFLYRNCQCYSTTNSHTADTAAVPV